MGADGSFQPFLSIGAVYWDTLTISEGKHFGHDSSQCALARVLFSKAEEIREAPIFAKQKRAVQAGQKVAHR
jgi:hypothetical protein